MMRAASVLRYRVATRTAVAAPQTTLFLRPRIALSFPAGTAVLALQCRTQYAQMPGKRNQEAFLTQFDPMDVLCVEPDCTIEDIDAAFEKMKAKYGPNGPSPDAKMVDRVFSAHEILKDPNSPYYVKAHSSQTDRQRLQFQLLPKNKRRFIEFQVCVLMLCALGVGVLVVKLCFRPLNRSLRAATR